MPLTPAMQRDEYLKLIRQHYETQWQSSAVDLRWTQGPIHELPSGFTILLFPPTQDRTLFAYATCGMSKATDLRRVEFFILSPVRDDSLAELINAAVHYHRTGSALGWMHLVNLGRPWLDHSRCDHGLFSLPYLDGEKLELLEHGDFRIRFLWLIPITRDERDYCKEHGLDALESLFEATSFDYADPNRNSVLSEGAA